MHDDSTQTTLSDGPIRLTPQALQRIRFLLAGEPKNSGLRLEVEGGGCSGFQYRFSISCEHAPDDYIYDEDGAVFLVDSVSLRFLRGAEIDFVDDIMGQSFRIHNPNATISCGCGTSFSV